MFQTASSRAKDFLGSTRAVDRPLRHAAIVATSPGVLPGLDGPDTRHACGAHDDRREAAGLAPSLRCSTQCADGRQVRANAVRSRHLGESSQR